MIGSDVSQFNSGRGLAQTYTVSGLNGVQSDSRGRGFAFTNGTERFLNPFEPQLPIYSSVLNDRIASLDIVGLQQESVTLG